MPLYALLGATGATGSSILRSLLADTSEDLTKINVLVRSRTKLLAAFPQLDDYDRVTVHVGDSTDQSALARCVAGADVVFMCVAPTGSRRGNTLVNDTAAALVAAIQENRNEVTPTVILLRSATLNPALARQVPRLVNGVVYWCLRYTYDDLEHATARLQDAADSKTLHYVLVDPPTMHDPLGPATGAKLLVEPFEEPQATQLGFADLGWAMCEVARTAAEHRDGAVGVTATGPVRADWGVISGHLARGATGRVRDAVRGSGGVAGVSAAIALVLATAWLSPSFFAGAK